MNFFTRVLNIFIIFVFLFLISGCASINFQQEYDKGVKFYNEKKYNEAVICLNNALSYNPNSYSALCLLGASYVYKKDFKLAEKTFLDATKLFPDRWNAYVLLGDLKKSQKDFASAIDYYETAVTLESMGGKEKTYYKKYIKELKNEQDDYNLKLNNEKRLAQRNGSLNNSDKTSNALIALVPEKPVGNVVLNLDKSKWEVVLQQRDEKSNIVEYGLKGEDVKNFKWSKLITVQYFVLSENFPTTLDKYFKEHVGAIELIAKNSGKTFEKKVITQHKNEILYEWKFDNAKETEISRIIFSPKCIYHIHVAKKAAFSDEEKNKYISLIKNAILE